MAGMLTTKGTERWKNHPNLILKRLSEKLVKGITMTKIESGHAQNPKTWGNKSKRMGASCSRQCCTFLHPYVSSRFQKKAEQ